MEGSQEYQLVFEGPKDESIKTLQQIKGVFIGELEFPVSDVQKFLESAPITIKTAASQEELNPALERLERAGARVLIVKPTGTEDEAPSEEPQIPQQESHEAASDEPIFEMILEGDQLLPADSKPTHTEPKEPKVYSLSLEDSEDAALFSAELLAHNPVIASTEPQVPSEDLAEEESSLMVLNEESEEESVESTDFLKNAFVGEETAEEAASPAPTVTPQSVTLSVDNASPLEISLDESIIPVQTQKGTPAPEPKPAAPHETFDLSINLEDDSPLTLPDPPAGETAEFSHDDENSENAPKEVVDSSLFDTEDYGKLLSEQVLAEPNLKTTPEPSAEDALDSISELPLVESPTAAFEERSAAAEDEHSEATHFEEMQPVPQPIERKKSKKAKSRASMELLLPILIGSSILGAANWFYLSSSAVDAGPNPIQSKLKKSLLEIEQEKESADKEMPKADPTSSNQTEIAASYPDRSVKVVLTWEKEKITKCRIELQTPEPAELTKEEIVTGLIKPPWLRRIESDELTVSAVEEANKSQAEGTGYAYIEYRGSQKRVAVKTKLGITYNPNDKSAQVRYQLLAHTTPSAEDFDSFVFEPQDSTYSIFASGVLNSAQSTPSEPAAQ